MDSEIRKVLDNHKIENRDHIKFYQDLGRDLEFIEATASKVNELESMNVIYDLICRRAMVIAVKGNLFKIKYINFNDDFLNEMTINTIPRNLKSQEEENRMVKDAFHHDRKKFQIINDENL